MEIGVGSTSTVTVPLMAGSANGHEKGEYRRPMIVRNGAIHGTRRDRYEPL
jgi:hypothetical protein